MDIFFSSAYAPFLAAILIVAFLGILEVAGLMVAGIGPSELVDWLSATDAPETAWSNWLLVRGLPLSIAIVLFLTCYATAGIALQALAEGFRGAPLSVPVAVAAALVAGWLGLRVVGKWLSPLFDGNTTAVSVDSFAGHTAVILSPRCSAELAAETRVTDIHGQVHMLMVTPSQAGVTFVQGDEVVLLERVDRAHFTARKA